MNNGKPLMINGIAITLARASSDSFRECRFCKCTTSRVLTFKKHGDPTWDILWACDYCLQGIKDLEWQNIGL
jgi:hypothetical protein